MAADGNTSKQSKKNKGKAPEKLPPELCMKVNFTPYEALKTKTREKLQALRTLSVALLPERAKERGFQDLQYVTLSESNIALPALLVVDSSIKHDASIISESNISSCSFKEGNEVKISSPCLRLIAEEVTFHPQSHKDIGDFPSFTNFLRHQLVQKSVVIREGSFIIMQYLSQDVILKVHSIKNFGSNVLTCAAPFECIWQTRINVENERVCNAENRVHEITFEDIGGYRKEIEGLKEEISRLFSKEKCGIKAVKGILISGAAGSGKSLFGEALRNEYKNQCINIDLEVTKSKFQGETELNLKQHFTRARSRAPCLVLIDDFDLLCSNRDHGDNIGVVTALLHLIDGLNEASSEGILVIATATKPQNLDVALRRPGRLSHDIFLAPPEESDREAILLKMLKRVPHDVSKTELESIASKTHGYVGGDLHNVMLEAVMFSEGRILTKKDLENSVATVKPMALKNTTSVDHKISLADVLGYESLKTKLRESLDLSLNYSHIFKECGLSVPTQYLIFGPPGCGKSTIIMALASEFHLNVVRVKRSTVLGKYFGESEQNLAKLFSQAQESAPCILHFENFEGLGGRSRSDDGGSDVEGRIINHLKVQLDGIVRNAGVFIFAETNRPDLLDKDVIRPGRVHEYYLISLPEREDRVAVLNSHLASVSFSDDVSVNYLIEQTEGFTVAEIIQLCSEIKQQRGSDKEPFMLTASAIEEALEIVSPSTSKKMLQRQIKFASIYSSS